jgi:hypothetical protein
VSNVERRLKTVFAERATPATFSLAACESFENGVVYLAYRPNG